jgi:hypothetical protein
MATILIKGDRVRLSRLALRNNVGWWSKHRDRAGTIVSVGRTGIGVCWDGNSPKSVTVYHLDYLAAIELVPS